MFVFFYMSYYIETSKLTCPNFSLSIKVMMKSLEMAKLEAPILSELSTIKAMSRGPHLHS